VDVSRAATRTYNANREKSFCCLALRKRRILPPRLPQSAASAITGLSRRRSARPNASKIAADTWSLA
jgi:hypothetical protein